MTPSKGEQARSVPAPRVESHDWDFPLSGYETDDHSVVFSRRWTNRFMVVHEMAHARTHLQHGLAVQGHGPEFVGNLIGLVSDGDLRTETELRQSAESQGARIA